MSIDIVRAILLLAGINALHINQACNEYDPSPEAHCWWKVDTPAGALIMGLRKNVMSFDWSATPVRRIVTADNVTKSEVGVHAYLHSDAIRYLSVIAPALNTAPIKVSP